MDVAGPDPNEELRQCKLCERKFAVSSLARHENICRKNASKKRKVFDSGKQRALNSDIPLQSIKKVQQEIKAVLKNNNHFKPPKSNWREKHEAFMAAVQAAKGVDFALKTGAPLPPPPKAVVPSDYVQCEFCGRNFSKAAADRHVPFCKESKMRGGVGAAGKKKPAGTASGIAAPGLKPQIKKPTASASSTRQNGIVKSASLTAKPAESSSQIRSAGSNRSNVSQQPARSASQTRIPNSGIPKPSGVPVPASRRGVSPSKSRGVSPSRGSIKTGSKK